MFCESVAVPYGLDVQTYIHRSRQRPLLPLDMPSLLVLQQHPSAVVLAHHLAFQIHDPLRIFGRMISSYR